MSKTQEAVPPFDRRRYPGLSGNPQENVRTGILRIKGLPGSGSDHFHLVPMVSLRGNVFFGRSASLNGSDELAIETLFQIF